ncbi:hypothetical protein EVG20_g7117 [Dentipellis fragilis]|uniref:C3H1-type domain-containing protein n=1 Tax=Dentipellis fragilis TaxID=205917 RepID=A0A4Y9YFD7_9AGAM|nr:hypothetical protein EVG20_g7117 [Dentipellis fragilis]
MAARTANQYQWSEVIAKVQELAETTVTDNVALAQKVRDLEDEVSVWKQAHAALKRPGLGSNGSSPASIDEKYLILAVIDGTRKSFSPSLLTRGEDGGRETGEELIQKIQEYLAKDTTIALKSYSVWLTVYVNRNSPGADILDVCSLDELNDFLYGLSQISPSVNIVDVKDQKESDAKIKEYIQTFATLPQTLRVFFGGGFGSEYTAILRILEAASASFKLVSLQGPKNFTLSKLAPPGQVLPLDKVFTKNGFSDRASHLGVTSPLSAGSVDEEIVLSQFEPSIFNTPTTRKARPVLDPNLPLYKQSPPPCNEHYLLEKCSKEDRCKYCHDYILNDEQLQMLAKSAKQSPCWYMNNGHECPYGPNCCWGHICPYGIKCFYLAKDKCRFKGAGMHRPQGDPSFSD